MDAGLSVERVSLDTGMAFLVNLEEARRFLNASETTLPLSLASEASLTLLEDSPGLKGGNLSVLGACGHEVPLRATISTILLRSESGTSAGGTPLLGPFFSPPGRQTKPSFAPSVKLE